MELINKKNVLIFLLVSVGLITLPHINHIPFSIVAFFYAILLWRFVGIWKPGYLPNKWLVLLLTISAIALLYTQHNGVFGRDAGTRLFIIALALKLLEIKTEKDLYLINYLAFIVAASQFLFQQSVFMAAYILFVCCALLATLVSINSYKAETVASLKTASIIILQALPLAIVIFVLFPRIEAPRWSWLDQQNTAKSGLSDSLEPGSISRLGLSDEIAFRVKFEGDPPPQNQRYWRGPVFTITDGKKWTESNKRFFAQHQDRPSFSGTPYHYTLMMEPHDKHWVFALDMPSSFPDSITKNGLYQLINRDNSGERAEYKITSYPQYNTGYITKTEYQDNLQLPGEPSTRIKQLVTQLHGFDRTPEFFIYSLLRHFREKNFYYTLMPPLMEENPIERFLFETRYGFCSHYATAFVYLMRVASVPARVVGGYQGGELNEVGGFLEVRQANAHAWAEVWLKDKGWTRIDPTSAIAPERIEQDVNIDLQIASGIVNFSPILANTGKVFSLLKQARQLWGSVDYSWQRWVINYSRKNQSNLLSSLGINNIKSMIYWMVSIISIFSMLLAWIILSGKPTQIDKELKLYFLFCKKMSKLGFYKQTGETAQQFAQRMQKQRPEMSESIGSITKLFTNIRYGKKSSEQDLIMLKKQVTHFKD